ncbi:MAG TPA: DUF6644 family protein [Burkholderiales bacterium]|nr:DUF6644 family protein [Burkholderiales bacterium]
MTPAAGPIGAIEASGLGQAMRQSLWLYPIVEVVHIVGLALLFGSIVVLDLRLLGLSRNVPVSKLARHVLPWSATSFLLIVPSGLAMFVAHASEFIANPVFLVKMVLIVAAGINAAVFHTGRSEGEWDVGAPTPFRAKLAGGVSLLAWTSVIACGRLLAYT